MKYKRLHKCKLAQDEPFDDHLSSETDLLFSETTSGQTKSTGSGDKQPGHDHDIHKVNGLVEAIQRAITTRELRQQGESSKVGDKHGWSGKSVGVLLEYEARFWLFLDGNKGCHRHHNNPR
ncbi:hypothetical protein LOK49_LG01G00334 [Camellia lanceoleosa]|uniref:Uncharacterized protein n=1 Tax=Camellia lanceoleosa TaxID=1840588 RepID=A0ACC0J1P7_9ERIC|nr:hypothetical protein LOK49_LG01G00334 [Camellia lanceoleosa]